MKRGCLITLLTWGACAFGYWYFTHTRLMPPLDWAGPLVAGLIMALIIGALRNAFAAARDAMRLSGQPGLMGEKPRDGDVVSVSGHIRASGSPMHAPISGRPAVLYAYEISHTRQTRNSVETVNDFSGFGLSSAVIDSSYGAIRLLGFPMLDAFKKDSLENAANAAKYIEETQFTDLTGFQPGARYREMKELMTDDDGHLKKDWRMTDRWQPPEPDDDDPEKESLDLAGENFFEQIVAPGDQVSAIGRYSAEKGGLVHDTSHPLQLLPGDASVAAGTLWRKAAWTLVGAVVFGAILNGVVFGVLKAHKPGPPIALSKETIQENTQALHDAARESNLARIEQLVRRSTPVDARDEEQTTPLMRASNGNIAGWLIAHGADVNAANQKGETPLMRQAQLGHADVVKLLVKSGAKLDTKSSGWKMTALQLALDTEKLDVAQALREAGAKDDTVTAANGHAVTDTSDEVRACREYLDAVQREDRKALSDLSTLGSFNDVDFNIWKKVRFANGRLVEGYTNADAATIAMRGATPGGTYVTWTYQLVRQGETWKISSERWETRFDGRTP